MSMHIRLCPIGETGIALFGVLETPADSSGKIFE